MPRIYPGYAWRIVRASSALWVLLRLALVLISGTVRLMFGASLVLVGAVVLLWWFDGRRSNDHLYHQNLGTPVAVGVGISLATTLLLELAATLLSSAVG